MTWRAHQQSDGKWFVQSKDFHAVTARDLTEIRAAELCQILNECAGLIPPQPSYNADSWWTDRVA